MARAALNFDGIQMSGPRRIVDPLMRVLVDQLDDCYYGTPQPDGSRLPDGWRAGVSKPFYIWDVQANPAQSKLAFDILSGIIHHLTFLAQHLFNCDHRLANPLADYDAYPELKYNQITSGARGAPVVVETKVRQTKRQIRQMLLDWNTANLAPQMTRVRWGNIVNYLRNRPAVQELLTRRAALDSILDVDNEVDTVP